MDYLFHRQATAKMVLQSKSIQTIKTPEYTIQSLELPKNCYVGTYICICFEVHNAIAVTSELGTNKTIEHFSRLHFLSYRQLPISTKKSLSKATRQTFGHQTTPHGWQPLPYTQKRNQFEELPPPLCFPCASRDLLSIYHTVTQCQAGIRAFPLKPR